MAQSFESGAGAGEDIPLECLTATVWRATGPVVLSPTEVTREGAGQTAWLELALPHPLGSDAHGVLEGSLDPWRSVSPPHVDWTGVTSLLDAIGVPRPALDQQLEAKLIYFLPFVYGRGVARVAHELWGPSAPPEHVSLFPTIGFAPDDDSVLPRFWALRTNIAVIGNVAITLRLPDLLCLGSRAENASTYRAAVRLELPDRFYPLGSMVSGDDIADGIALHQAQTARAVSEHVRTKLRGLERRWAPEASPGGESDAHQRAARDVGQVAHLTELVFQLDRQISRLLRRFGSQGEGEGMIPPEVKLRYRFALDELRSLRADGQLAAEAVERAVTTREREDRDSFQLVAAVLGAAILFPTLVAGIYGANVALPAEDSRGAFIALLLFVAAFAAAGLFAVSLVWGSRRSLNIGSFRSLKFRLAAGVVALVAFTVGVLQLASESS
jgi:hypothetical protein